MSTEQQATDVSVMRCPNCLTHVTQRQGQTILCPGSAVICKQCGEVLHSEHGNSSDEDIATDIVLYNDEGKLLSLRPEHSISSVDILVDSNSAHLVNR